MPQYKNYIVHGSENIADIAQREMGDESAWKLLVGINNLRYPYISDSPKEQFGKQLGQMIISANINQFDFSFTIPYTDLVKYKINDQYLRHGDTLFFYNYGTNGDIYYDVMYVDYIEFNGDRSITVYLQAEEITPPKYSMKEENLAFFSSTIYGWPVGAPLASTLSSLSPGRYYFVYSYVTRNGLETLPSPLGVYTQNQEFSSSGTVSSTTKYKPDFVNFTESLYSQNFRILLKSPSVFPDGVIGIKVYGGISYFDEIQAPFKPPVLSFLSKSTMTGISGKISQSTSLSDGTYSATVTLDSPNSNIQAGDSISQTSASAALMGTIGASSSVSSVSTDRIFFVRSLNKFTDGLITFTITKANNSLTFTKPNEYYAVSNSSFPINASNSSGSVHSSSTGGFAAMVNNWNKVPIGYKDSNGVVRSENILAKKGFSYAHKSGSTVYFFDPPNALSLKVLKSGDILLIPTETPNAVGSIGTFAQTQEINSYGKDIYIDPEGEISFLGNNSRDIKTVEGRLNVAQALQNRLTTYIGQMSTQPNFGNEGLFKLGSSFSRATLNKIEQGCRNCVLSDSRVSEISSISVGFDYNSSAVTVSNFSIVLSDIGQTITLDPLQIKS